MRTVQLTHCTAQESFPGQFKKAQGIWNNQRKPVTCNQVDSKIAASILATGAKELKDRENRRH